VSFSKNNCAKGKKQNASDKILKNNSSSPHMYKNMMVESAHNQGLFEIREKNSKGVNIISCNCPHKILITYYNLK
jgi:hypothetical protein